MGSVDINTEVGYITWKDWPSFIDSMLQFDILGRNTHGYYLPKHIDTIVIDIDYHVTLSLGYQKIPVFNYNAMKLIVAGGVQISGIKWSLIPRNLDFKLEMQALINEKIKKVDELQKELEHVHLEVSQPGDLTSLRWVESPPLISTLHSELCRVYYAGLNHHDLALALGRPVPEDQLGEFKDRPRNLGIEFSGRTSTGKRVMGIVQGGLATTVLADNRFLWEVPPNWGLEMAATVPVAFSTAYYALFVRGQVRAKQTVVIYHGSSDIGIAAIALAIHTGCSVYSTYGNREQRQFIQSKFLEVPDRKLAQHWDPTFEKMILERTNSRGADLILNLLGAEKIPAALSCLAEGGNLLHIGDDALRSIDMSTLTPNKTFHAIDMSSIGEGEKLAVAGLLSEGIRLGRVYPMSSNSFSTDVEHVREAFATLNSTDVMAKVTIRILQEEEAGQKVMRKTILASLRPHINVDKTYVLIGGPEELAMELGHWLVSRGATKLVISRADEVLSGYLTWGVHRWQQCGIHVLVSTEDTSTLEGAKEVLEKAATLGTVGGVFDMNMTAIQEGNKIEGIKILDEITREIAPKLSYFVIFSLMNQNRQLSESIVKMVQNRRREKLAGAVVDLRSIGSIQRTGQDGARLSTNCIGVIKNLDSVLVQPYAMVSCTL